MAGPALPTNRAIGTPDPAADANTVHLIVNKFDLDNAVTTSFALIGNGNLFVSRALLSTDIPGIVTNTRTASYVLVLSDAGKMVEMNVAAANTLTIPPNSSVAFPVGTVIGVRQYGNGITTLTAGTGVTIRSRGNLYATAGLYAELTITKRGTDEWVCSGDVA